MNPKKMSPQSRAVLMAKDDIERVMARFNGPPFMGGTERPVDPAVQDLVGRYPKYIIDLIARGLEK